jgi:hypothetical protein
MVPSIVEFKILYKFSFKSNKMLNSFYKSPQFVNLNKLITKNFSISSNFHKQLNVAVVLCGSGVYDGVELTEAASAIIHLSRHKAMISFFAPDIEQAHVINHLTGNVQPEVR